MIGGQEVAGGLFRACETAGITVEAGICRIAAEPGRAIAASRAAARGIRRQGYRTTVRR
jgi:hypothetical protein